MADDQDVCWPKTVVLLQSMVEQLEAEDVDDGEDNQADQAFLDE